MRKNKQGITLISTVIVVLILTILTGIITISTSGILKRTYMNEFEREYKLVKANTEDYIMRNSGVIDFDEIEFDLSKVDAQHVGQFKGEKIIDGKIDMYIIDLEKIGVETATYGIRLQGDENDVYLVSKDTNNVYYKKGYEQDNVIYYRGIGNNSSLLNEKLNLGSYIQYLKVPVGAKVTGYENTLTWKYIGNDDSGNALIIADVTDSTPKMELKGIDGYLNGPAKLNDKCDELYTNSMGVARNLNIDDIVNLLEYDGPMGMYIDKNGTYTYTDDAQTIVDLEKSLGEKLYYRTTPDGKLLEEYYSNHFIIGKNSSNIKATNIMRDLIYQNTAYWLASSATFAYFSDNGAYYGIRHINNEYVHANTLFYSINREASITNAIRPIVTLSNSLNVTYNESSNVLNLSL